MRAAEPGGIRGQRDVSLSCIGDNSMCIGVLAGRVSVGVCALITWVYTGPWASVCMGFINTVMIIPL